MRKREEGVVLIVIDVWRRWNLSDVSQVMCGDRHRVLPSGVRDVRKTVDKNSA